MITKVEAWRMVVRISTLFSMTYLMVKLEERIVYSELVTFEPFEKVTDDGQPVDDRGSHGGVGGGGEGVISLDGVQYYLI